MTVVLIFMTALYLCSATCYRKVGRDEAKQKKIQKTPQIRNSIHLKLFTLILAQAVRYSNSALSASRSQGA